MMVQAISRGVWPWVWGWQGVAGLAAEADGGVEQGAFDEDEDDDHSPEEDIEEEELFAGDGAVDAEGGLGGVGVATQRRQQQGAGQQGQYGQGRPAGAATGSGWRMGSGFTGRSLPARCPAWEMVGEASSEKGGSPS